MTGIEIDPGHGVTVSQRIAIAAERLWSFVGDFAGVTRWHPEVVACAIREARNSIVRRVEFADWWIEEALEDRDAARLEIAYSMVRSSRPGGGGTNARLTLIPLNADHTMLRWSAYSPNLIPEQALIELGKYYRQRVSHLTAAATPLIIRSPPAR